MSCRRDSRTCRIKHQSRKEAKSPTKQRQRIKVEGNNYAGDKLSGHHSSTDPSACGRADSTGSHRSNVSASGKVRYCNLPATRTNYTTTTLLPSSSFCRHTYDWFDLILLKTYGITHLRSRAIFYLLTTLHFLTHLFSCSSHIQIIFFVYVFRMFFFYTFLIFSSSFILFLSAVIIF